MNKYVVTFLLMLIILLVACSTSNNQNEPQAAFLVTPSVVPSTKSIPIITTTPEQPRQDGTQTPAVSELMPPPTPPIHLIPITPTATVVPVPNRPIESKCIPDDLPLSENVAQMAGMAFEGEWRGSTERAILGADGLTPVQFISNPYNVYIGPRISPNGQWAVDYDRIDEAITEVTIMNVDTGQETATRFEPGLIPYGIIQWLNETTLFTFLANEEEPPYWEGEIYYLFLWDVVTNQQITKTIRLEHIVPSFFYHSDPVVDPQQQYIIYLCYDCLIGKEGYVVKDIDTGETEWIIPLESEPEIPNRGTPVWSQNGQYVAVTSGPSLNEILIYNRQGKEVDRIVLPPTIGITSFVTNWSPDGKYLTFVRTFARVPNGWALAYYSLDKKHIIDLCISSTEPVWSPDGTKMVFLQAMEEWKPPQYLRILDVITGEVTSFYNEKGFGLVGWFKLPITTPKN